MPRGALECTFETVRRSKRLRPFRSEPFKCLVCFARLLNHTITQSLCMLCWCYVISSGIWLAAVLLCTAPAPVDLDVRANCELVVTSTVHGLSSAVGRRPTRVWTLSEHTFLPRDATQARYWLWPGVCLQCTSRSLSERLHGSTYAVMCYQEIWVPPKISVLPSENFVSNSGLKFRHGKSVGIACCCDDRDRKCPKSPWHLVFST